MNQVSHSGLKFRWILLGTLLFLIVGIAVSGYFSSTAAETDSGPSLSDTRREEVQRYFGYEPLLFRYLTLPFDVSMNVNQKGDFVDIGFLFLLILPVLLFLYLKTNRMLTGIFLLVMVSLFVISIANSNLVVFENLQAIEGREKLMDYLNSHTFSEAPLNYMLVKFYVWMDHLAEPVENLFKNVTGERDYISYPILIGIFLLCSFFIFRFVNKIDPVAGWMVILCWVSGFLWFILASGIVWYGYLLIALGYLLMILGIEKAPVEKGFHRYLKYGFYTLAAVWIIIAYISRVSNISLHIPEEHMGKGAILPSVYRYNVGNIPNETQMKDAMLPGLTRALTVINTAKSDLVWRIGTSLTYFIADNNKRVFQDNQLGMFQNLYGRYGDQQTLNNVFIASDVRFLIIDLNTTSLDITPEKSLIRKYQNLMIYIQGNPGLTLLATDRIVARGAENGETKYYYDVFGEKVSHGTYAIYRIN